MKLQLDFDSKTITLDVDCELKEFITVIQRILPDWQSWTLNSETTITWGIYPTYPYYLEPIGTDTPLPKLPWTKCGTSGIVNIDTN